MHLSPENGAPKTERFYPDGQMGRGDWRAVIIGWLKE